MKLYNYNLIIALCVYFGFLVLPHASELTIEPKFDFAGHFNEGIAPVKLNEKWGFIDRKGNWVVEPRYERVQRGTEGLFAISTDDKWGYVDTGGNVRIAIEYDRVRPFSNGYAAVKSGADWYLIDRIGRRIGNQNFRAVSDVINGMFAAVRNTDSVISMFSINEFNKDGNSVENILLLSEGEVQSGQDFYFKDDFDQSGVYLSAGNERLNLAVGNGLVIISTGNESLVFWQLSAVDGYSSYDELESYYTYNRPLEGTHIIIDDDTAYCSNRQSDVYFVHDLAAARSITRFVTPKARDLAKQIRQSFGACNEITAVSRPFVRLQKSGNGLLAFESIETFGTQIGYVTSRLGSVYISDIDLEEIVRFHGFWENFALFKDKSNKFGFLEYVDAFTIYLEAEAAFEDGFRVREGMAPVKLDGKWGYLLFTETPPTVERKTVTIKSY